MLKRRRWPRRIIDTFIEKAVVNTQPVLISEFCARRDILFFQLKLWRLETGSQFSLSDQEIGNVGAVVSQCVLCVEGHDVRELKLDLYGKCQCQTL